MPPRNEFPIGFKDITDGLSKAILVGEKHVAVLPESECPTCRFGEPSNADGAAYDQYWKTNIIRWVGFRSHPLAQSATDRGERVANFAPLPDGKYGAYRGFFGGIHPGVCQFVYGDGHVAPVSNLTSMTILQNLARRNDRQALTNID